MPSTFKSLFLRLTVIALLFFVFEAAATLVLLDGALGGREGSILISALSSQWMAIFFFALKVIGLSIAAALSASVLLFALGVRDSWLGKDLLIFTGIVACYVFFETALYTPQLFDEFPIFYPTLRWIATHASHVWFAIFSGILLTFAVLVFGLRYRGLSRQRRWIGFLILPATAVFLFRLQPIFPPAPPAVPSSAPSSSSKASAQRNVVLIGVDGLLPDALVLGKNVDPNSPLGRFLQRSMRFPHVISPIARTHPAYVSLFTGQTPPENGFRFNLSHQGYDTDTLFKDSYLSDIKRLGYDITIALDSPDFAHFRAGKIIDQFDAPSVGFQNNLLPIIFRQRFLFALFNNQIGESLLPEVFANGALRLTFRPELYTRRVLSNLNEKLSQKKPFFLVSHSTSLHWPGALRYPYYRVLPEEELLAPQFSYSSNFPGRPSGQKAPGAKRLEFFKNQYASGVRQSILLYLNPILQKLEDEGAFENSIIVLFSDHGETFWTDRPLPFGKIPSHGSGLLLGDHSPECFLAISTPHSAEREFSQTVGLIDLMPTLLDLMVPADLRAKLNKRITQGKSFASRMTSQNQEQTNYSYTSETEYWPKQLFPGQTFVVPWNSLWAHQVNNEGFVYLSPSFEGLISLQKQRALYDGSYRLTLFPTQYGYQIQLVNFRDDPDGLVNLVHARPALATTMLKTLLNRYHSDIENGYLPDLQTELPKDFSSENRLFLKWKLSDRKFLDAFASSPERYQWLLLQLALERIHGDHDLALGTKYFATLIGNSRLHPAVRIASLEKIYDLCNTSLNLIYPIPFTRQFLDLSLISESLPDSILAKVFAAQYSCMSKKGLIEQQHAILERLKELNGPLTSSLRTNLMTPRTFFDTATEVTTSAETDPADEIEPFAETRIQALAASLRFLAPYDFRGVEDRIHTQALELLIRNGNQDDLFAWSQRLLPLNKHTIALTHAILRTMDNHYQKTLGKLGVNSIALRQGLFKRRTEELPTNLFVSAEEALLRFYIYRHSCPDKCTKETASLLTPIEQKSWAMIIDAKFKNLKWAIIQENLKQLGAPAILVKIAETLFKPATPPSDALAQSPAGAG